MPLLCAQVNQASTLPALWALREVPCNQSSSSGPFVVSAADGSHRLLGAGDW